MQHKTLQHKLVGSLTATVDSHACKMYILKPIALIWVVGIGLSAVMKHLLHPPVIGLHLGVKEMDYWVEDRCGNYNSHTPSSQGKMLDGGVIICFDLIDRINKRRKFDILFIAYIYSKLVMFLMILSSPHRYLCIFFKGNSLRLSFQFIR